MSYQPSSTPQYPAYPAYPAAPPAARSARLGIVAFVLAGIALVGAGIAVSVAGVIVGQAVGGSVDSMPTDSFDFRVLSPVRSWVLLGEIGFWSGTVLGIWAFVQAIVAIASRRGRGWGVGALVIAIVAPLVVTVALFVAFGIGAGSRGA